MCAYCAGSIGLDGFVEYNLREQWKSLLPVCKTCRDAGALPLARTSKRNGSAGGRQAVAARLAEEVRADQQVPVELAEGISPYSSRQVANHPVAAQRRQVRRRNKRPLAPTPGVISSTPDPTHGVMSSTPDPTPSVLPATHASTLGV